MRSLGAVALSAFGCTLGSGAPARAGNAHHLARPLNREERLVIVLYYFEEMTMAEIGAVLNLSEQRVTQIYRQVLQRLRQRYASLSPEGRLALEARRRRLG